MLQNMRDNAQSWVAKVIVGVIVLVFALTGWESISRFTSDAQKAAEVNGNVISRTELDQAVSIQRGQLYRQLQQLGDGNFDPGMIDEARLRESVLDGMVERALLISAADDAGLYISDSMIDQLILATPDFQVDGRFDAGRFDVVIRNMGMASRLQFRDLVRQELKMSQLRNAYEATGFATLGERRQLARLENQTRDFAVIELRVDESDIQISDEEVADHYAANLSDYMSQEQLVLETLTLSRSSFFDQVEVDEGQLEAIYQREIGNLAEQRRASHIMFEVSDPAQEQQALERLQQVAERLAGGEDFAELARELSEDFGSASSGGDLGFTVAGSFDPAFEQALFALAEGEVSEPVRSEFGYHLIKLTALQAPEVPSFDEMRPELEAELKAEQVERRFVEATRELANLSYESPDLADPARALGLEVAVHTGFTRAGGEGILANPRVVSAAFEEEVLVDRLNSQLIELDADTVVVLRVREHQRPEQLPLEAVAGRITDVLRQQRVADQARQKAGELVASLRSGEQQLEQLADAEGLELSKHEAVRRGQRDLSAVLLQHVFAMPRPDGAAPRFAHFASPGGGQWLVRLTGVTVAEQAEAEVDNPMFGEFIAGQTAQQDFSALQEYLRSKSKIERY
ncbi:MAG: SurA N-terminal domain-containing protein [Halopseudomonas yangmingensis]